MYCLSCGAENNDSANFCQNCGATRDLFKVMPSGLDEVTQVSQSFRQPSFSPPSGNQNIVLIIAGIIVVIAVGAASYFYAKSEMSSSVPANQVAINTPSKKPELTPASTVVSKQIDNSANLKKQQEESQEALDKQEKEEEAKKFTDQAKIEVENLLPQMRTVAETISQKRHRASNLEGCTPKPSTIESQSDEKIIFVRLFDCRLKGKYLGINNPQESITVRAEVTRQGKSVSSKVLD